MLKGWRQNIMALTKNLQSYKLMFTRRGGNEADCKGISFFFVSQNFAPKLYTISLLWLNCVIEAEKPNV